MNYALWLFLIIFCHHFYPKKNLYPEFENSEEVQWVLYYKTIRVV